MFAQISEWRVDRVWPELVMLPHSLSLSVTFTSITVVHFVNLNRRCPSLSPGSSVLGHKSRCHLEGLALLLLNAVQRVLRPLASLCVGHTEHVISLDSADHARVAGDGLS